MRNLLWIEIVLAVALLFAGCNAWTFGQYGGSGEDCYTDGTCNKGLICCNGVCQDFCGSDGDADTDMSVSDGDDEQAEDADSDVVIDGDSEQDKDVEQDKDEEVDGDDDIDDIEEDVEEDTESVDGDEDGDTEDDIEEDTESVDGDCLPAVPDYDHDGVCFGPDCNPIEHDTCPTVWNPDNDASACEAWSAYSAEFEARREVTLSEDGATSTWRRTNEPVEIPLVNGILDDSVVGYWKLDDGQALDYSGNGRHGTLVGSLSNAEGAFSDSDGAFAFNGTDTGVVVENDFGLSSEFAYGIWVRIDETHEDSSHLVDDGTTGVGGYVIGIDESGSISCSFRNENDLSSKIVGTDPISALEWTNVWCTLNEGSFSIYTNGILTESLSVSGEINIFDNPSPLSFAKNNSTEGNRFAGSLDEILVFNRALSPEEISAYYESSAPYGTRNVPGGQDDFDDIRVTEISSQVDGATTEHLTHHEIVGPRPHSDTVCPAEYQSIPVANIPHIAYREDLCGVVGYWKLDGNGEDSSGNGFDLTPVREPGYGSGRFGNSGMATALDDSKDQYFTHEDSQALRLSEFTLEAWTNLNNYPHLITGKGFYGESTANYRMYVNESGYLQCIYFDQTQTEVSVISSDVVPLDRWAHLACIRDNQTMKATINGLVSNSESTPYTPRVGSEILYVGGNTADSKYKLDDVLIHSVAKSPEYIYRRANPGLPTVRFLAHTEPVDSTGDGSGLYPWMSYFLNWKGHVESQIPIVADYNGGEDCYGLLSQCTGYAGWWRFNEGAGTIAVDSSVNKNNGTLEGTDGLPVWVAGREGTALEFDGGNDVVIVPDSESLKITDELTVDLNISPNFIPTTNMHIISKPLDIVESALSGYGLYLLDETGQIIFYTRDSLDSTICGKSTEYDTNLASLDTWQHISGKHDSEYVSVWYNWEEDDEILCGKSIAVSSYDLAIGNFYPTFTNFQYEGIIDSVRIMNRALEPDEFLHYPLASWELGALTAGGSDER